MLEQNQKNIQFETPSEDFIRVRCPDCLKPFVVKEYLITNDEPQFSCSSCATHFWIPYAQSRGLDEFLGIEIQRPTPAATTPKKIAIPEKTCPKCGFSNPNDKDECGSCGVVISKYEMIKNEGNTKIPIHLLESWERALDDYENEQLHTSFINQCLKLKEIDYAVKKYSDILKAYGGDKVALVMKKKLMAIAQAQITTPTKPQTSRLKKDITTKNQSRTTQKLLFALMGFGLLLLAFGQLVPGFKNLMGLGASLVFISLTLYVYLK